MRYLDKRNEFLQSQKYSLIKENESGAGPFANDLGWHDSLLGRLIDNTIRKAKIRYNITRMNPLIERLKSEFDRINAEGAATQLSKEDWVKMVKLKLFSFFDNLKNAVDSNEEIEIIKSLTDEAIKATESIESSHEDFDTKETLLKELKLFKEFLDNYKEQADENIDALMVNNLTILLNIMKNPWVRDFKNVPQTKEKGKFNKELIKTGGYYLRSDKEGKPHLIKVVSTDKDSKGKIQDGYILALYYMPSENAWKKQTTAVSKEKIFKEVGVNGKTLNQDDTKLVSKTPIKVTSLVPVQKSNSVVESLNESNEVGISDDIKNKLKSSILLLTKNDKDFSITPETLEKLISEFKNDSEAASYAMNNLYKEIYSCLKGRRSTTVPNPDPLVKESYELLINAGTRDSKIPVMGELIAKFAKRAKQFEEGQLYSKLGPIGDLIHSFNESLVKILNSKIGEPNYSKKVKEEVKESVFNYNKFISLIKEADETGREVEDLESTSKIKDFFDKNCQTVRSYVMEKTEADKLSKNLDQLEKEMKDQGSFVIDGMDPIIEICRLFNRAFKLYIVRNRREISKRSERTAGSGLQYSSAFLEYTDLGNGGPWRNNKLFDMWEDAVLKILADRKYQHIFLKSTKMRIPKVTDPSKPEDYELREQAGTNLRKMLTDILDGDDLYKIGKDKGKQNEFLSKYFGEPDDRVSEKPLAVGKDADENPKTSSEIKIVELSFSKPSKITVKANTFFVIKGQTEADGEKKIAQKSFFVAGVDESYIYLMYSRTFKNFNGYLDKCIKGKKKIENFFPRKGDADMFYTRMKIETIKNGLNGKIKIVGTKKNGKEKIEETITVNDIFYLTAKSPEGNEQIIYEMPSEHLAEVSKFYGDDTDYKKWFSATNKDADPKIEIIKV